MVFIDLEKAYDKFFKNLLWWVSEIKGALVGRTNVIKGMLDKVVTSIKIAGGATKEFPINIDLHHKSI